MRRYTRLEEENIRAQAAIREWEHSGLIHPEQLPRLQADLQTNLRSTNIFLRGVLFLFTAVVVSASILLVLKVLNIEETISTAVVMIVAAGLCFGLAEILVGQGRLYRFGIEEACAVSGVVLLSLGSAQVIYINYVGRTGTDLNLAGLAVGAIGACGIYCRFGFMYAVFGSMICAALVPFQIEMAAEIQRAAASIILAMVFGIARSKRVRYGDEFPGDEYSIIQAGAWAGIYLSVNVHLGWGTNFNHGVFYWWTYVMTWALPTIGLCLGIPRKDRALMDVSLGMALVTLATNKSYLGWQRQPLDPILFGLFLMATAVALRRWLSNGAQQQRYGFTPVRVFSRDDRALTLVSTGSAALQPHGFSTAAGPSQPDFQGGRSGGGGASGEF
jgi:hypothetical protein